MGECGGGFLDVSEAAKHFLANALEKFVFELHAALFRAENFAFHLLEFGGDEAFAVGDGLFAHVLRRDFVEVGFGDFNIIAEDGIEADLEGLDACASDFVLLKLGDPILAAAHGRPESVQGRIEAVPNQPAFFDRERRLVDNGAFEEVNESRQFGELRFEFVEERSWLFARNVIVGMRIQFGQLTKLIGRRQRCLAEFDEGILERGNLFESESKGDEIAGVASAGAQAADGAFEIANVSELGAERFQRERIVEESLNRLLALANRFDCSQGLPKPVAQASRAHGSDGAVHRAEEGGRAGRVVVQWFENFQVAQCGEVEREKIVALVKGDAGEIGGIAPKVLGEIVQQTAGSADCGDAVFEAESVERGDFEVFADGEERGFRGENPVVVAVNDPAERGARRCVA